MSQDKQSPLTVIGDGKDSQNPLNKYIVEFDGKTARPGFSFERTTDFYESDDISFLSKLLRVLDFKNRHSGLSCVADCHAETVVKITKISLVMEDTRDYNEEDISLGDLSKINGIDEGLKELLINRWDVFNEDSFLINLLDDVPEENREYYRGHFDENLRIH